jgi:hypothetical protein
MISTTPRVRYVEWKIDRQLSTNDLLRANSKDGLGNPICIGVAHCDDVVPGVGEIDIDISSHGGY